MCFGVRSYRFVVLEEGCLDRVASVNCYLSPTVTRCGDRHRVTASSILGTDITSFSFLVKPYEPAHNPNMTGFLDLPAELRLEIYDLIIHADSDIELIKQSLSSCTEPTHRYIIAWCNTMLVCR